MKGPFSVWTFFGLTLWIDIISWFSKFGKRPRRVDPYKPKRSLSVIIPAYKEEKHIAETISSLYEERYPIKNIIVAGDIYSKNMREVVLTLARYHPNLLYSECPKISKAQKVNYVVANMRPFLGSFVYIRDARVRGRKDTIEKMMSYFFSEKVAAVTSYGKLSRPRNLLSRAYYYGKSWINEVGRFRKDAQQRRKAVFVICGASTIYRTSVLHSIPLPRKTKTEDTHYTWVLQRKGYLVRVADDAVVSAPDIDGDGFKGLISQLKQSYRWTSGTMQCFYLEVRNLRKNKRLFYTTILPGFLESIMYSIALVFSPLMLMISLPVGLGFLTGDAAFSLIGTAVFLPRKFFKTVLHYPEILFFKYLNAIVFLAALFITTTESVKKETNWTNEWIPPPTEIVNAEI
jgi:peptidoglycan-N-acetylglucosamine deacetylase